jgi:Ca2+:H+ antiporter
MTRTEVLSPGPKRISRNIWALIVCWGLIAFSTISDHYFVQLHSFWVVLPFYAAAIMFGAIGVMSHAEDLAHKLGEPYGTLILTLSAISIEVVLVASVMLEGESNPGIARDTMMATLMVILNGLVGLALLVGGLRYRQQSFNLESARSYLAVLTPLAVCALILPTYTISTIDPTLEWHQAIAFGVLTLGMYGIFLVMQTTRYTNFFREDQTEAAARDEEAPIQHAVRGDEPSIGKSAFLLIATLIPVALLSHSFAVQLEHSQPMWMTDAIVGVIIAILVMTPEGLGALHAAWQNQIQRSVNILLGSALATVGLTVPVVIVIGLMTGETFYLGLDSNFSVLLLLSLFVASITFGGARTDMLKGFVHLAMFVAFIMLAFFP